MGSFLLKPLTGTTSLTESHKNDQQGPSQEPLPTEIYAQYPRHHSRYVLAWVLVATRSHFTTCPAMAFLSLPAPHSMVTLLPSLRKRSDEACCMPSYNPLQWVASSISSINVPKPAHTLGPLALVLIYQPPMLVYYILQPSSSLSSTDNGLRGSLYFRPCQDLFCAVQRVRQSNRNEPQRLILYASFLLYAQRNRGSTLDASTDYVLGKRN